MKDIYLDNSATTRICDKALETIIYNMKENYGNPSSLHTKGFNAERTVHSAKKIIGKFIGCESDSIFFTSGGTESNNLAIMGVLAKIRNKERFNVVVAAVEHPSILNTVKCLEKMGFEIRYVVPNQNGDIDESMFERAIDENTKLVSCMMVNNELGAIYPVSSIKKIIKRKKSSAVLHVDAVQAFGKIPINVKKMQIDLLSISAHKVHGPKGVGALYVSKNIKISPIMFGGGQESGLRPGTEAVSLIAAFGEAVNELQNYKNVYEKIKELNEYLRHELHEIKQVYINSNERCSPYVLNFSVKGIKSEIMLHFLSSKGIYVSSGSACSKGRQSYVLKSIDMPSDLIDSSIRVSFSRFNTKDDIDSLILEIKNAINSLIKI